LGHEVKVAFEGYPAAPKKPPTSTRLEGKKRTSMEDPKESGANCKRAGVNPDEGGRSARVDKGKFSPAKATRTRLLDLTERA